MDRAIKGAAPVLRADHAVVFQKNPFRCDLMSNQCEGNSSTIFPPYNIPRVLSSRTPFSSSLLSLLNS